jgi:hypothetical protein
MIKLTDIYTAVTGLLIEKYKYEVYGHEVVEGYQKPSFFVNIKPKTISSGSVFYKKLAYTINITYFQETTDEIDNLIKIEELQVLFGNNLKINTNSSINISEYDYDFVGENSNILQLSMETEFFNKLDYIDNYETATKLTINYELKG